MPDKAKTPSLFKNKSNPISSQRDLQLSKSNTLLSPSSGLTMKKAPSFKLTQPINEGMALLGV